MAVLGRVLFSSAERVDLPDFLSIDSYAAGDWRYFIKSLVGGTTPYILSGFDVIDPQNAIGTQNCSIKVADSVAYYPGSNAGPFYYGLPAGNANSVPLVPELRKNAVNYVYLTFSTFNSSTDTRAFWDPDRNGGTGGEFTQDVNTESVLLAQINVSTGSFPANTIPVAKITVGPVVITEIEDARNLLFRLGSGGISPNPYSTYNFRALPASQYERAEPSVIMTNSSDPNPFQGADKNILTLKEWMDVVMTKLKELGGTTFWYEDTSSFNMASIFHDALATTFKSKGSYVYGSGNAGLLTWTEDVLVKSLNDPRDLIIRSGSISMSNEQVAYVDIVRNQPANPFDQAVAWTNGQNYVNTVGGSIGYFANLSKGDWIKKTGDGSHLYLQVQEFYDTVNLGGSVTTAANARSIRLSGTYQGSTGNDRARYSKGVYQAADVTVQDRSNAAVTASGGNLLWFAHRTDTVMNIGSIASLSVSGTILTADGENAQVSATAHGLVNGDRVTVTSPSQQAGTYSVQVQDANTFFFPTTDLTVGAMTANYRLLTTTTRDNGYGLQLESAEHGFESGETIIVAGTTNYNSTYVVNYRSATQVQMAGAGAYATETSGTATLARMDVRTEEGVTKLVQGETIDIGEGDSDNIQRFVGMNSLAEVHPTYFIPSNYGTIAGSVNYNSDTTDNLTARVSKLTAMMADKAQDKTIKYLCNAATAVNVEDSNPLLQDLTFTPPGSSLTILQPSASGNAVISLPSSPGIQLAANQSAYVVIDRNAASTPSIVVVDTASVPLAENIYVIASRLSGSTVYLWDGEAIDGSVPLTPAGAALIKVQYCDPVSTSLPTGNPVVEDGSNVQAGDRVLFTNLSSGNNQIYKALGTGTNITSWSAEIAFGGSSSPSDGDTVIVLNGTGFADQIGKFTGTKWAFNDYVRYFNGADYWEQSNLITSSLNDATTDNVFTVNFAGSEYMIIDFSLSRGISRENGTIYVTTDGSTAAVTTSGSTLNGACGIHFDGDVVGPLLRLRYTSDALGSSTTMKYMVRRWSNAPGGPGGLPNYTGGGGGGGVPAAGSTGDIQFNGGGVLAGNTNFKIDTVDLSINLNGLRQQVLSSPITLTDGILVPTPLFQFSSAYTFVIVEYSVARNGFNRVGRLLIANDGSVANRSDDYIETGVTAANFTTDISGGNVRVLFTTALTGNNGVFRYSMRKWG